MTTWGREHLRHAATVLRQGRNPAAAVYDSIGPDFFLALDEGWLNLGLWEGDGSDPAEAPAAVRRLVETVVAGLPTDSVILDVGNGLGAQDPVIAATAHPKRLVALNITRSQLVAGERWLAEAGAHAVNGDATRMPIADERVDGVISIEAAFHFSSRTSFFAEAFRILRPGGVLTMTDVPTNRLPRGPVEAAAALTQLRVWGLRPGAAATAAEIADQVRAAGFERVETRLVGERVIGPALRFVRARLDDPRVEAPAAMRFATRVMLAQMELLWRRGIVEYLLLRAAKPG